jgi:acyl-CoA thioesterase
MTFFEATQVTKTSTTSLGASFDVTVPDGWQQGPGAFGGWVLAVLVRGIEAVVPDRALRSLTAEIPAPVVVGTGTVSVEVLRAGQSVTVVAARLLQESLKAHAVAVLGSARPVDRSLDHTDLSPPVVTPWQETPPVPLDFPLLPTFARHFAFRPVIGAPFTAGPSQTAGWIHAREPGPACDDALVVGHVDAWYPAEFPRLAKPRRMVTSAFTMQMVEGPRAWTGTVPLLHVSKTLAAFEGYVTEARQLWTPDGKLVALNQQTMVMVK